MRPFCRRAFLNRLGALGAGLLTFSGCQPQRSPTKPQTYVVEMKDFFFDPLGLVLHKGDRVVWLEVEDGLNDGHTATAFHPKFDKVLRIPKAATAWGSGFLFDPNAQWERRFSTLGVHDYFCIPHEDTGMVGRIVVDEASGPGAQPLNVGLSAAAQATMPSLEELSGPVGEVFNVQGRLNAVTLDARRAQPETALERWRVLLGEVDALLPQLLGRLSSTKQRPLRQALASFDEAINATTLGFTLKAVDRLKILLERAAYTVS